MNQVEVLLDCVVDLTHHAGSEVQVNFNSKFSHAAQEEAEDDCAHCGLGAIYSTRLGPMACENL